MVLTFLLALQAVAPPAAQPTPAPAWTHGATCYEVFVRSFYDSDGDGTGDLNGLTQKLDYIKGLGASCIWLIPIMVSPSYHGYDVVDYYKVEPAYGTNDDFKRVVAAAHARGIAVLIDMVLNHTSSENPWFKAAVADTASPYRAWYRFSDKDLGSGPWGAPAWHKSPVRYEYYYGVFWSGMPDLNWDNPAVLQEAEKIADFWLRDMGVDGFRLDAVPYLVEEGTCLAGCPRTHTVGAAGVFRPPEEREAGCLYGGRGVVQPRHGVAVLPRSADVVFRVRAGRLADRRLVPPLPKGDGDRG
jgi:alpha-amylase